MNAIRGDESEYKVLLGILRIKDKTVKIKCYQKFCFHNYKGAVLLYVLSSQWVLNPLYIYKKFLNTLGKLKFLSFLCWLLDSREM